MDLTEFLIVLRRFWWLVLATTVAGLVVATVYVVLASTAYTATAKIYFSASGGRSGQDLAYANTYAQSRMEGVKNLVGTPSVLDPVISSLGLETTASALSSHVSAANNQIDTVMEVSAHEASPVQAAKVANAVAASLITEVAKLETPTGATTSSLRGTVIGPATVPTSPSSPDVVLAYAAGVVLGLGGGLVLAILWHLVAVAARRARA